MKASNAFQCEKQKTPDLDNLGNPARVSRIYPNRTAPAKMGPIRPEKALVDGTLCLVALRFYRWGLYLLFGGEKDG